MKPAFKTLWHNYPDRRTWKRERLFQEIGWESLIDDSAYENTCAIRMSIALRKSGVLISSSAGMKGRKGAMKGRPIGIRQDKLSHQLRRLWGKPENAIDDRDGVISSFRIPGYLQGLGGHIDLVDGRDFATFFRIRLFDLASECGSRCHWNAGEIWFWELP